MRQSGNRQGFTLIELSIVLVIIGLIVGGVLTGQSLIAAAAVRAQIAQIEKFNTAANTFYGKYGFLPGDIPARPAAQFGFVARGAYPGEGDGNGILESVYANGPACNSGIYQSAGETVLFWVDLSTANLIEGGFNTATASNVPVSNITGGAIGNYLPQGKIGNGSYVYVWSYLGDNNYFGLTSFYVIIGGNGVPDQNNAVTVAQAYNIDKKIDDGYPQLGRVTARTDNNNAIVWNGASDTSASSAGPGTCYDNGNIAGATQQYSLTQNNGNGLNCSLSFKMQAGD